MSNHEGNCVRWLGLIQVTLVTFEESEDKKFGMHIIFLNVYICVLVGKET